MSIKLAFAAVLRTLRRTRGLSQEHLADALSAAYLSSLETGKATPSLAKLNLLSEALHVSPGTLIVLAQSVAEKKSTTDILERVRAELTAFESAGGLAQLAKEMVDGELVKRNGGKRFDDDKLGSVLQCKAEGLTQSETARRLGLSTSTVHDLWKRNQPTP